MSGQILTRFARMLGIGDHQAEDALHSERAARAVLSRRDLFAAGAAMATGLALSQGGLVAAPLPILTLTYPIHLPSTVSFYMNGEAIHVAVLGNDTERMIAQNLKAAIDAKLGPQRLDVRVERAGVRR